MKLTSLLLVTVYMNVWATGFGQKVTLSGKDLPLEKVFSMIKKQTGYAFFYDYSIFQDTKPVTLNLKDAEIEDAMRVCLWDQDLDFSITNKTISVVKKMVKKAETARGGDPEKTIKAQGTVLAEGGQPLSGATVTIKQTKRSTLTNAKGEFELIGIPNKAVLVITYIGYNTQQITFDEKTPIQVRLTAAVNQLDEAVVQAYGTTSQRLITGNIGKVTSSEIERQPVMNPLMAIQGKVAGLDISQTSGFASAPFKVELRGRSTVGDFSADPLFVIDGVPLSFADVSGQSNYSGGSSGFLQTGFGGPANGQSPLFGINPADIESIEVLKDADATSIYGSRGANGVILISTKKGKAGKTKFNLHLQQGIEKVTRFYKMLDTKQYVIMRNEAFKNDQMTYGAIPGVTIPDEGNAYDLVLWDTTKYTDWQKALWGGQGKTTDIQTGLSGGDSRTTFRLGAGYNRTTNILSVSGSDQRATVSMNITHRSVNQRLNIGMTAAYSYTQSDMIFLPGAVNFAPNAPAIYDSTGKPNFTGWGGNTNNLDARGAYPFSGLFQPYVSKTNFLNSNLVLSYQLMKGLSLVTSFGYNTANANQQQFNPIISLDPASKPTGTSNWGYNSNKNWIIEPQLTYNSVIARGKLSALVGGSAQQTNTDGLLITGSNYTSDNLIKSVTAAPKVTSRENYGEYKYSAVFGRITYNWDNKYIVNLNARRDGSSRFGPNKQFGNFGSVGVAWVFSEEPWVKDHLTVLSFGKLRASYGTTGSDAIGDYQYLSRYSSNNGQPYNGISVLVPTQASNTEFQWQVNKKLEAAVNLGLFKDQINVQVAYYRNRCGNQLVGYPLPLFTGFPNVTANSPALVQNDGWEFTGLAKVFNGKKFSFSVDFNLSINRNKLVSYPDFNLSPYVGTFIVGKPLNIVRRLHFIGVDPQTGQYAFYDKNHDGIITIDYSGKNSDDTYVLDMSPKFFGGLGVNMGYESFQLSLFFNFKKQIGFNAISQGVNPPGYINTNQRIDVLSRWQKPQDITNVARFTTQPTLFDASYFPYGSDAGRTDASYIRLSNLSLSYNLPVNYIRKINMESCSIFLHMNNLFIITRYKGIDPETQTFGAMPPSKTIVAGLSFGF